MAIEKLQDIDLPEDLVQYEQELARTRRTRYLLRPLNRIVLGATMRRYIESIMKHFEDRADEERATRLQAREDAARQAEQEAVRQAEELAAIQAEEDLRRDEAERLAEDFEKQVLGEEDAERQAADNYEEEEEQAALLDNDFDLSADETDEERDNSLIWATPNEKLPGQCDDGQQQQQQENGEETEQQYEQNDAAGDDQQNQGEGGGHEQPAADDALFVDDHNDHFDDDDDFGSGFNVAGDFNLNDAAITTTTTNEPPREESQPTIEHEAPDMPPRDERCATERRPVIALTHRRSRASSLPGDISPLANRVRVNQFANLPPIGGDVREAIAEQRRQGIFPASRDALAARVLFPLAPQTSATIMPRPAPARTTTPDVFQDPHMPRTPATERRIIKQGTPRTGRRQQPREAPVHVEVPYVIEQDHGIEGRQVVEEGFLPLVVETAIAHRIVRSWPAHDRLEPVIFNDHMRSTKSRQAIQATLGQHGGGRAMPAGQGCRRCENGGNPFIGCVVHPAWSDSGACLNCMHGGRGVDCSFARARRGEEKERKRKRTTTEDVVEEVKRREEEEIERLAASPYRPVPEPTEDMSAEELREYIALCETNARRSRIYLEAKERMEKMSPKKRRGP